MDKTSIFGLDPDQLDELLSLGSNIVDGPGSEGFVEPTGSWIGRYQLLRVLGEGGMGVVYMSQQHQPMKRQVAIKIIKPGMDSKRVIARFETERQALALLDHPNIAHIYDAGTTESGYPYFVMEYVQGMPITDFCDHYKLDIHDRLRLFLVVCQAIHHAHQKGIIHRDIKPSNILVAKQDSLPAPKIIDFGVAKAMSEPLTEHTLKTEDSQLLGTPEYMSPEQVDMAKEDIDTRSDIYSLGVLLYVLLTGVLPFDSGKLRTGGIEHIRQVIRETDPRTPSTRLIRLGEECEKIAENRRIEIHTLAKHLKKELEWVPLKAMRKERSERYRSASELADDIDNYLNGAPLIAGPPTAGYRLRKSLSRHKILLGGIVAVLGVSIIGTIVSVKFALGQARSRTEAERQARTSQAVTNFLSQDLLGAIGRVKGSEHVATDVFYVAVAKLLDVASEKLEGKVQNSPAVEAEIRVYLGNAYWRIRGARAAIPHFVRSYELRRALFGEPNSLTVYAKFELALASGGAGQYDEAERLWKELIETSYRHEWECNLALTYLAQGRYEEAERLFVKHLWTDTPWWKSWYKRGIPYIEDLAIVYLHQGRYKEAEQLFNQFMAEQGDDVIRQDELARLGYVYMAQGRFEEAADLFNRGIEYCSREFLGKGHRLTFTYTNGLAILHTKQKQYEEAERLFQEILAIPYRWDQNHPLMLETINAFGVLRREQKDYEEAEQLLQQALEVRQRKLDNNHPACFESMHELAVLYKEQTRYYKAEQLLLQALEGRRLKLGDTHPHTLESWKNLIDLYEAWGKPEKAAEWRVKLPQDQGSSKK